MFSLIVIILGNGSSRRFVERGYETIKPLLRVLYKGETKRMIEHVGATVAAHHSKLFVLPKKEISITTELAVATTFLSPTKGQAETALKVLETVPDYYDYPVLFLDCDMLLDPWDVQEIIRQLNIYDCVVGVTRTFDPNASRVDSIPFPRNFAEKEPISEWGIVSARGFKSSRDLRVALERSVTSDTARSEEPYLSSAINFYPGVKYAHVIGNYVDWGTPERLAESGALIL